MKTRIKLSIASAALVFCGAAFAQPLQTCYK